MNTKNPSISVIIPAYNEEKYIARCLSSLKKQTYKDFEIIVVDNNSTDKTAEIAQKYGARVVKENIQGMTPARERGFREAKAEIIARTDADTILPPNWLEEIYKSFQRNPKAVGILGIFTSPYKWLPDVLFSIYSKIWFCDLAHLLTGHYSLIGPNMALKKSAWQKVKVHTDDKIVHEDIDLACHLAEIGPIIYEPKITIVLSYRRITENPLKGTLQYLTEYPYRYFRTILIHHPHFARKHINV
ncbi:hypothetical protein A2773_07120 [Candidatus Gottesmanbacteria bacterium RIFCSPHIGHO2_01_FULL_39_10]|uniref:Glycosyltransferase 2-like domain-containing protein n=1 Tax=Candidatus Gottesmanbacteria bacterium RIFCSPHIGHO2_01_FULL_39_10 TaxID=1798375 RepID=A0A1F5ZRW3_9BACT|nr:MAG: hypothetical protein A2773_07120 [Candidatus Gottesmanbacteria bacterium RIFCSPHIGHO2_01_FULL_39_10]